MIRIAVIDREKCKAPDKCDYICIRVCPPQKNNIKVFEIHSDKKPIILEEACIGCGICVKKCPFNAITIINLTKEPDKSPIHQYGPNSFRLYRLPIIKDKSIVGIIGRNGMGKTTAIKILSGLLKPNLGNYNNNIDEKQIIEFFKGSELQKYFTSLYNGEIKVSYKPQNIFLFIKLYKGKTVREFIEKSNISSEILESYGVKKLLDRKIEDLSGGELQKLLILLTSEKPSDVYLYDEPTAYLDIYERLRSAIYIKNKTSDKTSLIIDHDLLFLDYISEIIHIVYGVPKAYGVFSYPIGAREGINQYLSGFIKRENLRIRDKPIDLKIKPFSEDISDEDLISWSNIHIKLNGFELISGSGNIKKKEIIGIIGRNGIGKSTFVKALAGKIKYSGEISGNISVGYKPQYLDLPEELYYYTVEQFLKHLNPKFKSEFNEYLFELGISDMFERYLKDLSGGELQTVLTFGTLIQDKELFLLDEPFAFLDIEQRVRMSRFIREIIKQREKSAVIIEHDLMFINYISDRLMVFLGDPGVKGYTIGPIDNKAAINEFLKSIGITIRVDKDTGRPRINKPDSYLDRIQKSSGMYYAE